MMQNKCLWNFWQVLFFYNIVISGSIEILIKLNFWLEILSQIKHWKKKKTVIVILITTWIVVC